jgi:hypothetical protein
MALIEARFKLEQQTKGAVRYQEVNVKGAPEIMSAKIGSLYIRKTAFNRDSSFPKILRVTIEDEATSEKE